MFYSLAQWLDQLGGPALFDYTSSRAIFAFVTAFVIGLVTGRPIIHALYRRGMRSMERSYGDIDTKSKAGTPMMGGLILIVAGVGSCLLWCDLQNPRIGVTLLCALWFAGIGFYDDYQKVKGRDADAGMSRVGKYLAQFGAGAVIGLIIVHPAWTPFPADLAGAFYLPGFKAPLLHIGWLLIPFAMLVISFTTNAVNFTDGLDGLVVVPSLLVFLVLGVFSYIVGNADYSQRLLFDLLPGAGELAVLCSAMGGACLAFLWFNAHPAEVFMGDTGSLMLGGAIGSTALLIKQEALFLIVGGIFVAELMSSLLQERGLKKGKRLFFQAPLHHGFKHQGMSETKIVVRLWIVSTVCAVIALATLKVR